MNYKKQVIGFFTAISILFLPWAAIGQDNQEKIIKIGFNPYFGHANNYLYTLHFEYEKYFKKLPYLTHGFGFDYAHSNLDVYLYRYNFTVYPFYRLADRKPYRYLFMGASPLFCHNADTDDQDRFGPGISVNSGFQILIKNKFSLSTEIFLYGFRNLNKQATERNSRDIYTDGIYCFKIGILLK
jgi:hypothetical protein